MILSTINIEGWQAATGFIILLTAKGLDYLSAFYKDRRERLCDEQQLLVQREIRDVMRQVEVGQTEQNGKLAQVVMINDAHHDELIRTLQTTCKGTQILNVVKPESNK